jgi:plastocyanin
MNASTTTPTVHMDAPPSALGKLTVTAVLCLAGALIYLQTVLLRQFQVELTIFAAIMGAGAAIVAGYPVRRRWTPLLGALLSFLVVGGNVAKVVYDLTHPDALHTFAFTVVAVALALTGVIAGSAATLQNYRHPPAARHTPRWLVPFLSGVAVVSLSTILVAAVPTQTTPAASAEVLAGLPSLTTPGFSFEPAEIRARVGTIVEMRLDNTDRAPHSFDIDELDVHVPAAPGKASLVRFTPQQPGIYTFYCAVPGHRALGMVGRLVVE